jgi:cytochrome c
MLLFGLGTVRDLSNSSPAVGPCQVPTLWQGISPGSLERIVATARSIVRSTYAPHRNLGIGLHHIPGASGFPGVPQEPTGKGADTESGQLTFNNACRTCHTTKEGDNRLGPNLHNIIGRKAGSLQNYGYSSAMKGADFVWDKEKLGRFIAKPDEVVPGNNMKPYGGLTSAEDRAKVIVFLESPTTN